MWSVIVTFAAAVAVIYLSYLCSKYVGKTMNKSSSSTYMKLVDQIVLGQDRHIAVVEVGKVSARRYHSRADQYSHDI